ncbi:DUF4307 domain-containing protein [Actinoplanes sp. URMC 104]|uniref:DUF4307 domain-containing protein n=1 Tax=Actinoplanes sp. URMC 104 TaxID=3423409 RepID=UPI003F1AD3F7
MSETRTTDPVFPPGRYGRRRSGRRRPVLPIVALVLVIAASVLLSVKLFQQYGQTDYDPQIVGWEEPSATVMTIKFKVHVPEGGAAECILRARDYDGFEVGRRTVVVRAGAGESTIDAREDVPTKSRASVGDVIRCRAAS